MLTSQKTSFLSLSAMVVVAACGIESVTSIGCHQGPPPIDPQVLSAHRQKLVLSEEPDGAIALLDLRQMLEDNPLAEEWQDVVAEGVIGGMVNPWKGEHPDYPWSPGEATFFFVDTATAARLGTQDHEAGEDHDDCPFCARAAAKNVDSIAVVNFSDEQGNVLKIDARELFELHAGDTVIIRGRSQLLGGSLLVIEADGIYVRR